MMCHKKCYSTRRQTAKINVSNFMPFLVTNVGTLSGQISAQESVIYIECADEEQCKSAW